MSDAYTLPGTNSLYFVDLEREKEINIGVNWEWDDLGPDECIVSHDYKKKYHVHKGDVITFAANYRDTFRTLANVWNYNRDQNPDLELPFVDPEIFYETDRADIYCTVKDFSSDGSGKFPATGWEY